LACTETREKQEKDTRGGTAESDLRRCQRGEEMWIVGFDPGGKGQFGWCVLQGSKKLPIAVRSAGVEDHAEAAVERALCGIPGGLKVEGAAIDAPLFWTPTGDRKADQLVRKQIRRLGALAAAGTVQHVNSLRGACLVQGVMTAHLLRRAESTVRVSESHPKALLWLLDAATPERQAATVTMDHISHFIQCETEGMSEHERDAAVGALSAWAMVSRPMGWKNLFPEEVDAFAPASPAEYWMPVGVNTF
jgi:hypothetical protein